MADALGRLPEDLGEPHEGQSGQREDEEDRATEEIDYGARDREEGSDPVGDVAHLCVSSSVPGLPDQHRTSP